VLKEFILPDIGEGIAEVEIIEWKVQPGDTVGEFDELCSVQSDKASVEIPSPFDGVVTKLFYAQGDIARVGQPLCEIDTENEEEDEEGEGSGGDATETSSSASQAQETVVQSSSSSSSSSSSPFSSNGKVLATPAVRRIARENNIDLAQVNGNGKAGRVLKGDLLRLIEQGNVPTAQAAASSSSPSSSSSSPSFVSTRAPEDLEEILELKGYSRLMFKSMQESLTVPHFALKDEINMNNLIKVRADLNAQLLATNQTSKKVSFMPFIIKATSLALAKYPTLNSSVVGEAKLQLHHYHNIGVAMDTPRGLVVPNIKNVEHKSILDIHEELLELQRLGSESALGAEHLTGTTFTISNIGLVSGTYLNPIITLPQVAIGAIGKIHKVPRYLHGGLDEDELPVPTAVMNVSWSGDHRVIDGATMANFNREWIAMLENPSLMLSSMR
jgi:2-oxoisovalerate dehydrogenase E2 component (dihydrolipoyl transacylase)